MPAPKHIGETFRNRRIRLDPGEFRNCKFFDCVVEYGAAGEVVLTDCEFGRCSWSFVGAAGDTLAFMTAMYQGMGPDMRRVIEDTFNNIRSSAHPDPTASEDRPKTID